MWLLLPLWPLALLAVPLPQPDIFDDTVLYLQRYGYLRNGSPTLHELRIALKLFQEVAGVEVTGELDEATVAATQKERCSHEDTHRQKGRSKRFALSSTSKWDKKHFTGEHELSLKWFVSDYTKDLPKAIIRSTIQKAFMLWSKQSNARNLPHVTLKFEEATSQADADINILWAEGEHGDMHKFDGLGKDNENILAHTFFPGHAAPLNGDIHFDDAENWGVDVHTTEKDQRFFPYVLAHEIGHALGLQHSKKAEALMNPFYKNIPLDQIQLDIDDKCGINWNYIGSSNFCLFVWLMSEIIPLYQNSQLMGSSNHYNNNPDPDTKPSKRKLKQFRIPRCLSTNDLQALSEMKLQRILHFPPEEARQYSEVVCNFLAGLHVYRGGPDYSREKDTIEAEFHGVNREVSEFGPAPTSSVRRMVRRAWRRLEEDKTSVFDPLYFNAEFFERFFSEYLQLL